jgi:hypothetical protein
MPQRTALSTGATCTLWPDSKKAGCGQKSCKPLPVTATLHVLLRGTLVNFAYSGNTTSIAQAYSSVVTARPNGCYTLHSATVFRD